MKSSTPSLFDAPARARHDDPVSSHQAARRMNRSGKAAAQKAIVLQTLQRWPGRTSYEVAQLSGLSRHDAARRLPELRKAGLVTNGRERICGVTGTLSLTWHIVQQARFPDPAPAPGPGPSSPSAAMLPLPRRRRTRPQTLADLPASTSAETSGNVSGMKSSTAGDAQRANELIDWFRSASAAGRLPAEPFVLRPGERIIDPPKFYQALATDIAAGPTVTDRSQLVPRARWRPLLNDLADLRQLKPLTEDRAP